MAGDVSLVEVMARLVAAFALIIGLLGGALYVFRRRGMIRLSPGGVPAKRMQILERQNLSRSSSIAVVRVGTSSYLVGSTDQNVSMLADVTEAVSALDASGEGGAGDGGADDSIGDAMGHATDADATDAHATGRDQAHQRTGVRAADTELHSPRMDLVGAILQRMNRQV